MKTLTHDALAETLRKIDAFAALESDWDSYGGKTISAGAIEAAKEFMQTVTSAARPHLRDRALSVWIAPVPNGNILFKWEGLDADLEVEVIDSGELDILLASRTNDGYEYREETDVDAQDVASLLDEVLSA